MGKVVLARVDTRLIHGQVMTSLSKSAGATAIFVADNPSAHDEFTKNILLGAGSRTGLKVRVLKEDGAVRYWNDRQYDNYNVILLTKTIEVMAEIIRSGVPVKNLNLGGIPQRPGLTPVIKEVSITKEQLEILKDLRDNYGVNVYFQAIPSSKKVSLAEAEKLF
ncbi:PTS system mannose/fructose/N-acetylgalactosamine-transporter subunit IIB [Faecalicoccus pleomorphus]|jgi:PTS system mannose-specific IIB component|uniref:PTS system mannose/fructose/N-acetylgalactosamine-transporter subunit IIB n=1 Tax=Faecalicoccus pleomorphus TaxID=1323 RepID=UPI00156AB6CA|nr:PTS sugar transporter subunit IIB [Faecalicoccus pleomorphus]